MGKPHACWRGAVSSRGEWLCFIDADVRAAPDLIAAAVQTAQTHGIDMLSLHPFQELGSFWERLIVPPAALMIACATNLRQVDDPGSSEVTANGQFILIRRDVYFAVGGHAAVRDAICEDKALAGRVKRGGWRFRVLGAEHLARTRMYTGLASLWEGFSKNAIEIMGDAAGTIAAALGGVIVAWGVPAIPIALGLAGPGPALGGELARARSRPRWLGHRAGGAGRDRAPLPRPDRLCSAVPDRRHPGGDDRILQRPASRHRPRHLEGPRLRTRPAGCRRPTLSGRGSVTERRSLVGGWQIFATLDVTAMVLWVGALCGNPLHHRRGDWLRHAAGARMGAADIWAADAGPACCCFTSLVVAFFGFAGYWIGHTAARDLMSVAGRLPQIARDLITAAVGPGGISCSAPPTRRRRSPPPPSRACAT